MEDESFGGSDAGLSREPQSSVGSERHGHFPHESLSASESEAHNRAGEVFVKSNSRSTSLIAASTSIASDFRTSTTVVSPTDPSSFEHQQSLLYHPLPDRNSSRSESSIGANGDNHSGEVEVVYRVKKQEQDQQRQQEQPQAFDELPQVWRRREKRKSVVEEVHEATEGRPYVVLLRRAFLSSDGTLRRAEDDDPARGHNVKRLSRSLTDGEGLDEELLRRILDGVEDSVFPPSPDIITTATGNWKEHVSKLVFGSEEARRDLDYKTNDHLRDLGCENPNDTKSNFDKGEPRVNEPENIHNCNKESLNSDKDKQTNPLGTPYDQNLSVGSINFMNNLLNTDYNLGNRNKNDNKPADVINRIYRGENNSKATSEISFEEFCFKQDSIVGSSLGVNGSGEPLTDVNIATNQNSAKVDWASRCDPAKDKDKTPMNATTGNCSDRDLEATPRVGLWTADANQNVIHIEKETKTTECAEEAQTDIKNLTVAATKTGSSEATSPGSVSIPIEHLPSSSSDSPAARDRPISRKSLADLHHHILTEMNARRPEQPNNFRFKSFVVDGDAGLEFDVEDEAEEEVERPNIPGRIGGAESRREISNVHSTGLDSLAQATSRLRPTGVASTKTYQESSKEKIYSASSAQEFSRSNTQSNQKPLKLWKRFGDPPPVVPNAVLSSAMRSTRSESLSSPLTPISSLSLDPNDPFIMEFMKMLPDSQFDERTGTLSGVSMWFLGKLTSLDAKIESRESLESLFQYDEIEGFRNVFETFDKTKRGKLDKMEIEELMETAGMYVTTERSGFLFELMDKNRSGFVEWEDFLVHMYKDKLERIDRIFTSAAASKSPSDMLRAKAQNASFNDPRNAGVDKLEETDCLESTMLSGLISAEQLYRALVQHGLTEYSLEQVERLVLQYDDDRDGYLDREDLLRML